MSDRITRKDIRRDEFVETLEKGVEYTQGHVRSILVAVAALVGIGALGWGFFAWRNNVRMSANDALAQAMHAWSGTIDAAAPKPDDPTAPTFASEDARRVRAKELFTTLVRDHSGTSAGDVGNLYLAAIATQQGQIEEARGMWQKYLASHRHDMLAASVQLDLLRLDRAQGKGDQVIADLRKLIDDPDRTVPQDTLLFELARTLESQGKLDEARKAWQRITDEYPRSPYAAEAQSASGAPGAGARPL
jgi:TolA-binding protein